MSETRTHFPYTTAAQRRLLFETWEATGKVEVACQRAHVGRRTFFYWKPRFGDGGYAALEDFVSRAPHHPARLATEIAEQVVALHQAQPAGGKQRLAEELATANGWVPLAAPTTVRRVLRDAGVWTGAASPKKSSYPLSSPAPRGAGLGGRESRRVVGRAGA